MYLECDNNKVRFGKCVFCIKNHINVFKHRHTHTRTHYSNDFPTFDIGVEILRETDDLKTVQSALN